MGQKTIENHKDASKNTANSQAAGCWGSKGTARQAWPYDIFFSPSLTENTDETMDCMYTLL